MPSEPIPISTSPPTYNPGMSSSLFGKWSAFSPAKTTTPDKPLHDHHAEHHDSFEHDSLEFGDMSDLKARGWAAAAAARGQRRAVSMSVSPSQGVLGQNVITSPSQSAIMNDKMARGQGVLRRMSLSNGFTRPQPAAPPPVPNVPNSTPIGSLPAQQPTLAAHPPAQAQVNRAGTIAGSRRRFSESTARKRGVSPMGERILRDHF